MAIVLWATLALGAASTGSIPPFLMTAITFAVAGVAGAAIAAVLGRDLTHAFCQPPRVWLIGVGGLFGYHFFYFLAFRLAPGAAVEVNLINYLWPLLIVLLSGIGVAGGLGRAQLAGALAGALAGLVGCVLIVGGRGNGISLSMTAVPGYLSALACALLWSGYSVLSGRLCRHVPTEAVVGQCLATAALAALCHLAFETAVWPSAGQMTAALLMGLGPMGAAFYVWDYGVKQGDVQTLGALCYAAPLMSTILLVASGTGQGGPNVWAAAALIIGGAVLASRDLWRRQAVRN